MITDTRERAARDRAVEQLKKRRDFRGHLLVYVLVNTFLVVIWAVIGVHGFFWPVFPILGWGIGVVMNAWDVYWRPQITEQDVQHEIEREDKQGSKGAGSVTAPLSEFQFDRPGRAVDEQLAKTVRTVSTGQAR